MGVIEHPTNSSLFIATINHEIGPNDSTVRGHGQTGAFVSKLVIEKDTLLVVRSTFIHGV